MDIPYYINYKDFLSVYIKDSWIDIITLGLIIVIIAALEFFIIIPKFKDNDYKNVLKQFCILGVLIIISFIPLNCASKIYFNDYNKQYVSVLYEHYDDYQPYIEDIIKESEKNSKYQNEYTVIINKDNKKTKIKLNNDVAEFSEKSDPDSEESYYKLLKNDQTKKIILTKYTGKKEQFEIDHKYEAKKIIIK